MQKRQLILPVLAALFLTGCDMAEAGPSDWTFMNASSWEVAHLYVAPTRSDEAQGIDLLEGHRALEYGTIVATPISKMGGCGEYDVLVIFKAPAEELPSLHLEGIDVCDLRYTLFVLRDDLL